MKKLSQEVGYLKGLREGLKLDDTDTGKLLTHLIDAYADLVKTVNKLRKRQNELFDYVDGIDDDLTELMIRHEEEDAEFEELDDDDESGYTDDIDDGWLDEGEDFEDDDENGGKADIFKFPAPNTEEPDEDASAEDDEPEDESDPADETEDSEDDDDFEDIDDEDDGDADEFFESLFSGCLCPECEKMFCVKDPDFDNSDKLYRCPYCGKNVPLVPIEKGNIPIAQPVDEEE